MQERNVDADCFATCAAWSELWPGRRWLVPTASQPFISISNLSVRQVLQPETG